MPRTINGVGVHEWALPDAATMGSAVVGQQARFAPAVDVERLRPIPIANVDLPGLMSAQHVQDLQNVVATRPIVVDYAIRADTLTGLDMPTDDTVTGTGAFVDPMTRVLLIGSTVMTGWYAVTASDGTTWTMERMAGLTYGETAQTGQMTLCRDTWGSAEPVYCWVTPGGVPIGSDDAKMLPLHAVGMPFVATTPAGISSAGSAGSATTVSRSDHVHAHGGDASPTANKLALRGAGGELNSTWVTVGTTPFPAVGAVRVGSESIVMAIRNTGDTADLAVVKRNGNSVIFGNAAADGSYSDGDVVFNGINDLVFKYAGGYRMLVNSAGVRYYGQLQLHSSGGGRVIVTDASGVSASLEAAPNSSGKGGDVNLHPGNGTTTHGVTRLHYGSATAKLVTSPTGVDVAGVVTTAPNPVAISATGTTTLDCSKSRVHVVTVNVATCSLALSNTRAGGSYEVHLVRGSVDSVVTFSASFEGYAAADTGTCTLDATHTKAILAGTCLADAGALRVYTRREQA